MQDGRGSADRGQPATSGVLPLDNRANAWISSKVLRTGAAREENAIVGVELHGGQAGVRMHRHSGPARHVNARSKGSDDDLRPRAPEQIDRGDGLDFLKAFGEQSQDRGHEKGEASTEADEHLFLNAFSAVSVLVRE